MIGLEGACALDRVVADGLDAEEASVGLEADLPQGGQVVQPFADAEVAGVVDGRLGAERSSFLVVLLDLGVFVVEVQARGDPAGQHAGAEPAGGLVAAAGDDPAVEDHADVVGASDVEVVADDLLEEDASGCRPVEHLGEGELGLQDRDVVGEAGGDVVVGERVRQDPQPLGQQRLDVLGAEGVADGL
jgi:hypothetical protein